MIKNIFFVGFLILSCLFSCVNSKNIGYYVKHYGALKNIMHHGDLSSKIDLMELENLENLYALGAVEQLKGEILIMNSKPYISSCEHKNESHVVNKDLRKNLKVDNSFENHACLLVYSIVENWTSFTIPYNLSYRNLESFIENTAKINGYNIDEPFPFLISGKINSIDVHVIDWPEEDKIHTHEKHINSGFNKKYENKDVEMLGFYSNSHHTIFTHHTTNMHIHVKTNDFSAHVDDLIIGKEMILKLPKINK
jgi:acetolactate decarboxylase